MPDHLVSVPLPHACLRAKERYGIDLNWSDLRAIARRCKAGEGRTGTQPDGRQYHMILWGDRILQVVYLPKRSLLSDGIVLTIMPPEIAVAAAKRADLEAARRRGDYRPRRAR